MILVRSSFGMLYYLLMGILLIGFVVFFLYRVGTHASRTGTPRSVYPVGGLGQGGPPVGTRQYKSSLVPGTKQCPACAEAIQGMAQKCRYCGEWFEIERPMGRDVE